VNEAFANQPNLATRFPLAKKAIRGNAEELIAFVKDRAGHDRRYAINPKKSMTELNYSPIETFDSGILKTLHWYLDNKAWWENLLEIK